MKLHEQVKMAKLRKAEADQLLSDFALYLSGPKFQGHHPQDGTPNDWVNVREVQALINRVRNVLDGVDDDLLWQAADD